MNPSEPELPPPVEAFNEPDDFPAMLVGATLVFVASVTPYLSIAAGCCLPQILGALLAIHLFTSKYALTLTAGRAMKLGIFTCLIGSLAAWAVAMALYFGFDYRLGAKESEAIVMKFVAMSGNSQAVEQTRQAFEQQRLQAIGMGQIAIQLAGGAVFAAIAGVIGGAIGAALFKRGPREMKQ